MTGPPKYTMALPAEMRKRWQEAADKEDLVLSVWIRRNCEERLLEEPKPQEAKFLPDLEGTDEDPEERRAAMEELSAKLAEMLKRNGEPSDEWIEATLDETREIVERLEDEAHQDETRDVKDEVPDQLTVYDMLVPDPEEM